MHVREAQVKHCTFGKKTMYVLESPLVPVCYRGHIFHTELSKIKQRAATEILVNSPDGFSCMM